MNARVVSDTVLRGATSSLVTAVRVLAHAEEQTVVLRRFTDAKWVEREPDLAIREGRSLQHATRAGLPVPELIALDADGSRCGVPATLVTRVEGEVVLRPGNTSEWARGMARAAAHIHRVDAAGFPWKYRRYNEGEPLSVPGWSREPEAWKTVIDIVNSPPPPYRECFVHRDYHPGNVLWENGVVSGVVDWVNGCRGPAGIDVAWCRHNLANLHGVAVADEFLDAYVAEAGPELEYQPYWDSMSVVELLPGPPSMYDGWRAAGMANISNSVMRERIDAYVASVVARL